MTKSRKRVIALMMVAFFAAGVFFASSMGGTRLQAFAAAAKQTHNDAGYYVRTSLKMNGQEMNDLYDRMGMPGGLILNEDGSAVWYQGNEYFELNWADGVLQDPENSEDVPYTLNNGQLEWELTDDDVSLQQVFTLSEDAPPTIEEIASAEYEVDEAAAWEMMSILFSMSEEMGGLEDIEDFDDFDFADDMTELDDKFEDITGKDMEDVYADPSLLEENTDDYEDWDYDDWTFEENTYVVGTVADMMDAVEPGATIILLPGTYNLTEWLSAHDNLPSYNWDSYDQERGVYKDSCFDGDQVIIYDIDYLTIMSADAENPAEIVIEPRYSNVLNFSDCDELVLDSLVVGHTPEQGYCSGGVVYLDTCFDVRIDDCDLYGCGTYGLEARYCSDVELDRTIIHDCTYGMMELTYTDKLVARHCTFSDCEGYGEFSVYGGDATFIGCTFKRLESGLISTGDDGVANFIYCVFDRMAQDSINASPQLDESVFVLDSIPKG